MRVLGRAGSPSRPIAWCLACMLAALAGGVFTSAAAQAVLPPAGQVDAVFSRWSVTTPGCAVGVSQNGRIVLERAYGLADLERESRNRPDTIFEAGSVAKQFTAAAVLLLARDGRLSLDDAVRKYVPELPDYGVPMTIRHLLTHTSGLRDWGDLAAISGWPRGARVHTEGHVLDITRRQRALNFPPGTYWSYCNTGYNLAAIIVSRVSGEPFAEFTRKRIFVPLGMTHTSWRDDHTRVVKRRAVAYVQGADGYHVSMPFENVHGNGGLLTTVGDLLRWNANFERPKVGDAEFVRQMQETGKLADGRDHGYAMGLFVGSYKGVSEVAHGGATAGYAAGLARYPRQQASVAVLCNVAGTFAEQATHAVADIFLGGAVQHVAPRPVSVAGDVLDSRAGVWRNVADGTVLSLVRDKAALKVENGAVLVPLSASQFVPAEGGQSYEFEDGTHLVVGARGGISRRYERVAPVKPTVEQLRALTGLYASDEAEAAVGVLVHEGELLLEQRPDRLMRLRPLYADAFDSPLGIVRFRRDDRGRVVELSVTGPRVWDLRFQRAADKP